uniref:C-type lectin domain-containing protein n=1 Tax=Anopheles christyi TaxID=43041 RepID=A0A182K415_9DIPT
MLLYKTVISSFVAAVLLVLSIAVASESPEPNETKTDVKSYSPGDVKDVNNFPVNGLPPLAYSSKKYTFHFELVSFFQAWNRCRAMGKRLASIENYQDHMAYREAVCKY